MKLWAGRFQKETDDKVNDFNSSISFDARLYRQDITGSIAHATMLGEQGIIAKEEAEKIVSQRTDRMDRPLEPQRIQSIRVETNGVEYPFTKL